MHTPTATTETDLSGIMSALSLKEAALKQPAPKKDAAKTIKELPPLRSYQTELLAIAQAADVSALFHSVLVGSSLWSCVYVQQVYCISTTMSPTLTACRSCCSWIPVGGFNG